MADAARALLVVIGVVEFAVLICVVAAFAVSTADAGGWAKLALLVVIAIGFEEGARRAARLQIRLASHLRSDMTSVWTVTGAVALDPARAAVLVSSVFAYIWFRQQRPAGEPLYRKLFTACAALLGCLVANEFCSWVRESLAGSPAVIGGAVAAVCGIAAVAVVNRAIITVALMTTGVRLRQLVGTVHDNLIELATLCLGGLVAVAVLHEPLLTVLVLAPMVALQRGALVRELEEVAITDAKTGLLNAVAWEQLAQREIARSDREGKDLTVLIVDIDRFKAVNDRFGHLVGDQVLRGIGRCLAESLRGYDGVGRFGGEEFVAVLPDTGERSGLEIAERVRARINQLSLTDIVAASARPVLDGSDVGSGAGHISVSIGVAVLGVDGPELTDLLYAADQALYGAKRNGRNQVQLARRGNGDVGSLESALR